MAAKSNCLPSQRGKHVVVKCSRQRHRYFGEEQPFIFERFYRSPHVRASEVDGSGIGLSLLKAISDQIGVTIETEIPVEPRYLPLP